MSSAETTPLFDYYASIYLSAALLTGLVVAAGYLLRRLSPARLLERERRDEPDYPRLTLEALEAHEAALDDYRDTDRPYQAEAVTVLTRLRRMDDPRFPAVLGTLRKMNAYAFEELLAICLAERGLEGYCPPGYSRDGGVDAMAFYEGRPVVVQAKRWRRHVSAHDLRALADLAERVAGIGLFVHTGRTGRASWRVARKRKVNVLSGGDLVDFVLGRSVAIRWEVPDPPESTEPLPGHLLSALEFARQVPATL